MSSTYSIVIGRRPVGYVVVGEGFIPSRRDRPRPHLTQRVAVARQSALSPRSQLELLGILARESAAGHAQFIVSTYSPILLTCPGAAIWNFDEAPPCRVAYEQTESVRLYQAFLADPERHLSDPGPRLPD